MKTSQLTARGNFALLLFFVLTFVTLSKTYSQDKFDSKKYDVDKQDDDKIKKKVRAYRTAEVDLSNINSILKRKHKQGEGFNFTLNVENESLEFRLFENDIMNDNSTSKKVINTYAGYVNNNSENYVRLYLSDKRLSAVYKTANGTFLVTPFDDLSSGNKVKNNNKVIVYKQEDDLTTQSNIACGYYLRNPKQAQPVKGGRVAAITTTPVCQVLQIVVETDFEFWDIYKNENDIRAKVAEWYNLAEQIYIANFNLRFKVTLVRIDWKNTNAPYPYTGNGTSGTLLNLFTTYWQANLPNLPTRNLAMMLSGKGLTWGQDSKTSFGDSFPSSECKNGGGYCMSTVWHKGDNALMSDQNISRNICHEIGHTLGAGDIECTTNVTVMCPFFGKSDIFDENNKTLVTNYLSTADCTSETYKLATTNEAGFTNDLDLKYDGGYWSTPTFINNNAHILSVSSSNNNLISSTFNADNSNVYFWYKNNTEARFEARSTPTFTINVYADAKCFYSYWNIFFKFGSGFRIASYPNPTDEGFTIENVSNDKPLDQSPDDVIKIDIFDEKGNLTKSIQSKNEDFIDTKNLKNGIYFLHLNYPNLSKEIKRIIVNH